MRKLLSGVALAMIVGAASTGSYWLGRTYRDPLPQMNAVAPAQAADRQPSYYQDPSGKPVYSQVPKKDANGRDYVPIYEDVESAASSSAPAQATTTPAGGGQGGKLLSLKTPR